MITILLASIMGTVLHLKRKCPRCRRQQIVKPEEKRKKTQCKFCGAGIPPLNRSF